MENAGHCRSVRVEHPERRVPGRVGRSRNTFGEARYRTVLTPIDLCHSTDLVSRLPSADQAPERVGRSRNTSRGLAERCTSIHWSWAQAFITDPMRALSEVGRSRLFTQRFVRFGDYHGPVALIER